MIPLLENRKVCRIYKIAISCFLIDMKFISKVVEMFLMGNLYLSEPPFVIFKNIYSHFQEQTKHENEINKKVHMPFKNEHRFFIFSDMKIICLKDVPINFLYCLKSFGDDWEVYGPCFDKKSKSRNHPKRIGICPGALISHFGIIKTQKYPNGT